MQVSSDPARALVGWKRSKGQSGIVLTMEVVESAEQFGRKELLLIPVALNERMLRSLARDLARAAQERGIPLYPRRSWWKLWRARQ